MSIELSIGGERLAQSFEQVSPMHAEAAHHFYARLLEIAPEVQPRLRYELSGRGQMFMATLGVLVRGLREAPALMLVAAGMAERYVTFGAGPEQLPKLGDALIETLEHSLGEQFTTEVRSDWVHAYAELAHAMTRPAASAVPA
jgi:hemoglobin-like flavoprotein